jgi:hypothetical protein
VPLLEAQRLKPSEDLLLATGPSAGSFPTVNQIKAIAQELLVARAAGPAVIPTFAGDVIAINRAL